MTYNRFLYNSALYNAGREEAGAIIRSIISAHTGPHIQAVVGSDPQLPANQSGISFISDFTIVEGTVGRLPTSFYFPDLQAAINAVRAGQEDLAALLQAIQKLDMPACVFPVAYLPDLGAALFGYIQQDLPASIFGKLAELDLSARLQIVQEDLGGVILGIEAPNLPGRILGISAPNLGAIIWAPENLPALLTAVQKSDLPADIFAFQFGDVPGRILGISAPTISALIKGFSAAQANLPGSLFSRDEQELPATISSSFPGPNDIIASIASQGDYYNLLGLIRRADPGTGDLLATIGKVIEQPFDLQATVDFLSALNLSGSLSVWPLGRNDKFLPSLLQPVHLLDISAAIESNANLKNLSASIISSFGFSDLGAFLRAAETFVTAILTVSTYATANLRATIGNPACAGGSATAILSAIATAQQVNNLNAYIESFMEHNLGAAINQNALFYAMDSIEVLFSPKRDSTKTFFTTDTIDVLFSPFRGLNLGAFIQAVISNLDLSASITAQIPLPRVEPSISRLTAAELRLDHAFDIQEVRIQMEGQLLDYFYANGTEDAFIQDAEENWKINVRGFRPIADGLFGEFGSARVCRLGNVAKFSSLDEAMRSCIAAVIGFEGESDLTASLNASGGINSLPATMSISDVFLNLGSVVNRVFPLDLSASTASTGGYGELKAIVSSTGSGTSELGASIDPFGDNSISATINFP